jgi:hypothetical protein
MAQKMVTPLATSLLHFQLNKLFNNTACILALFGFATVLATYQKILGNFFPNHLVTLVAVNQTLRGNKVSFWLLRQDLGPYSQHLIFVVTYEQAKMSYSFCYLQAFPA